jgi:hypothetical protein
MNDLYFQFDGTTCHIKTSHEAPYNGDYRYEVRVIEGDDVLTLVSDDGHHLVKHASANIRASNIDSWVADRMIFVFGIAQKKIAQGLAY